MANAYDGKRISGTNVNAYLKSLYGEDATFKIKEMYNVAGVTALLQKDYGKDNDCALTSLTACLLAQHPGKTAQEVYDIVEECAEKSLFYNGNSFGTFDLGIKYIFNVAAKKLGKPVSAKRLLVFDFAKIKSILKSTKNPLVLSIQNDGRNFYKTHSITVVGCITYTINTTGETRDFLMVYDNWVKRVSYVDFDKLGCLRMINYC